jgi:integrase
VKRGQRKGEGKGYRNNNRGTLVLDRVFKGVGRIKRASGTTDPKVFKNLDGMLGTLYDAGRVDILRAVARGTLSPLEVWARFRVQDLASLPTVETIKTLKDAMEEWLEDEDTSDWNRAGRRYAIRAILRHAKADATVADLPAALRDYKKKARGTPAMFNRTRAAALAFLRDTLGRSAPLYGAVMDLATLKEAKAPPNPQTVAQMVALTAKLDGDAAAIAWGMAMSGMGPGEMWGAWTELADRIHIKGTKRSGRVRDVPRIGAIAKPTISETVFRKRLKVASDGAITPYDLRHTFSQWMQEAGIPRARRKVYMGHGRTDVTDLYERGEVTRYLLEDAAALRKVVGSAAPTRLVKLC